MDLVELLIDENNLELTIDAVSLVEFPAMESNWVFMSKENKVSLANLVSASNPSATLILFFKSIFNLF